MSAGLEKPLFTLCISGARKLSRAHSLSYSPDLSQRKASCFPLSYRHFVLLEFLFSWFMLISSALASSPNADVIQRINYGVIFQPSAKVRFSNEYWLHSYLIPIAFKLKTVSGCPNYESCQHVRMLHTQLNSLETRIQQLLNNTVEQIYNMIPTQSPITGRRSKRALLGFIGFNTSTR